jgi:hypothetical protein
MGCRLFPRLEFVYRDEFAIVFGLEFGQVDSRGSLSLFGPEVARQAGERIRGRLPR